MTPGESFLLARCAELERRLNRERTRVTDIRQSRDRWRRQFYDLKPDALAWREFKRRTRRMAGGAE